MVLLSACTTVKVSETHVLHPKKSIGTSDVAEYKYAISDVAVTHADGVASRGLQLTKEGADVTVLYFGGNQFHLDMAGRIALMPFVKAGVNVVSFDHRGYGRSDGKPTIALLASDALDAYNYVRKNFKGKIVVYGFSLGSFIASHVASTEKVDALILEGTTSSTMDWAGSMVPWYAKPFVKVEVDPKLLSADNERALGKFNGPLLVVQGSNDEMTPPNLARKLYEQVPSTRKVYKEVPGYGHNNLGGSPEYMSALTGFLGTI